MSESRARFLESALARWWLSIAWLAQTICLDTDRPGAGPFAAHASHGRAATSWIPGSPWPTTATVTAYTGKCDLGQGMLTVQAQLVAEELGVAIKREAVQCDTAIDAGPGHDFWQPIDSHQLQPAKIWRRRRHRARGTVRHGGAEAACGSAERVHGGRRRDHCKDRAPDFLWRTRRRATIQYRYECAGEAPPAARMDRTRHARAIARSRRPGDRPFEFVHNVRVPGMVHGRVVRPPAIGATVVERRRKSVAGIPGLIKVVVRRISSAWSRRSRGRRSQAAEQLKGIGSRHRAPEATGFHDYRAQAA